MVKHCAGCQRSLCDLPGEVAVEFVARRLQEEFVGFAVTWTPRKVILNQGSTEAMERGRALLDVVDATPHGWTHGGEVFCGSCYSTVVVGGRS